MAHCKENACFVLVAFVFLVQARASSICHECTNVADIGLCLKGTQFCGINENCYVRVTTSTNQKQFTFGCMPVAQCATPVSTHTFVGRRASTQICEECCPGDLCNTATCEKAHAPWGQWSVWATCSKTCGGGTQTRTRSCNNAASGSQCVGDSKESRPCGVNSCPGLAPSGMGDWLTT